MIPAPTVKTHPPAHPFADLVNEHPDIIAPV